MNTANAWVVPTVRVPQVPWFRAVPPALALSPARPSSGVTRFNPGPSAAPAFQLLYFAPDPVTALFEVEALLGSIFTFSVPNILRAARVFSYKVPPSFDVADLGNPNNQRIIDTTRQELTGDWRTYRSPGTLAPTQAVADALYQRLPPIDGILSPSARNPNVNNLILFYDRVVRSSRP